MPEVVGTSAWMCFAKDCFFVEDGKEPAIAEGTATIGIELLRAGPLDTVVVPVGDRALIAALRAGSSITRRTLAL